MSDLQRERAPFSSAVWSAIDEEARRVLELALAGRKVVDFIGPLGWNVSAIDTGRVRRPKSPVAEGVESAVRLSQSLVEFKAPFRLDREELMALERGAKDADLGPVVNAAKAMAHAEDSAIFHGYADACIYGITEASASSAVELSPDYLQYPDSVAEALAKLRNASVDGPYAIVLGPRCYQGLTTTRTEAGYPILQHVKRLVDGPIVWAPAVDGAIVMSTRGGDFELTVGRDLSIGYEEHDAKSVHLYVQESLAFRCYAPEAAVPLRYAG